MFSNNKASPAMLIVSFALTVVAVVLAVLAAMSFNNQSDNNLESNNQNTEQTNIDDQLQNPDNNIAPDNQNDNANQGINLDKAMNSVPTRGFPENKCPQGLAEETSQAFALDNDKKYLITKADVSWIKDNCPDTKLLNF